LYHDDHIDFDGVLNIHQAWKNQSEYCVIAYPTLGAKQFKNEVTGVYEYRIFDYWAFMVSKRGNKVYQKRVSKRLQPLNELMIRYKGHQFFDGKTRDINKTNVLMVTLTYDTSRNNVDYAWKGQGKDFNSFISRLKQRYGKVSVIRSWERYHNGYPHVHAIILFHDHTFRVHKHTSKKSGKTRWLIPNKDNKTISSFHHSYVQQSGVSSLGGIAYTTKYIKKEVFKDKENKTLVACWLYGKQQWSISKDFTKCLHALISESTTVDSRLDLLMHNSSKHFDKGRVIYYVGIKIIPNANKQTLFRLKPPPEKKNIKEFYKTHDNWLKDFSVSTLRCDICGIPLFKEDATTITEKGVSKTCCLDCMVGNLDGNGLNVGVSRSRGLTPERGRTQSDQMTLDLHD
jgi:hypothetical protein